MSTAPVPLTFTRPMPALVAPLAAWKPTCNVFTSNVPKVKVRTPVLLAPVVVWLLPTASVSTRASTVPPLKSLVPRAELELLLSPELSAMFQVLPRLAPSEARNRAEGLANAGLNRSVAVALRMAIMMESAKMDRKSVVQGKRVDFGGG